MDCDVCGFEILPGSRFCGRCGMTLPEPSEENQPPVTGDTSRTLIPSSSSPTGEMDRPSATTQHLDRSTASVGPGLFEAGPETVELAPPMTAAPTRELPQIPACPQCGYLLQPEARFCNGCGYLVAPAVPAWESPSAVAPAAIGGRPPWLLLAAIGGAVALAVVGGFIIYRAWSGGDGTTPAATSTATPIGGVIGGAGSGVTPTATASRASAGGTATSAGRAATSTATPAQTPTVPAVMPTSTPVILPTSTRPPPTPTPVPPAPTPTPTPIPFSAFNFGAAIDAYSYNVGDTATLCYYMTPENVPYTVVVTQTAPYTLELGAWDDDGVGGGDCTTFPIIADDRPGFRLVIDAYIAGGVLTVQLSATVY